MPVSMWPKRWKSEYQTIIPKKELPGSENDCRNLACTIFFSKVMESFVLDSIRSEISLSNKQYGGIKGCGVNNLLVDMRNHILTGLDEEESAVTLMAVDFSKAFNRMSHQHCLAALARKGCPTETIKMVYSFLQGRVMYGYEMSRPRGVNGGSPQGTKLGNLLF